MSGRLANEGMENIEMDSSLLRGGGLLVERDG